jgi:hypothetical protein
MNEHGGSIPVRLWASSRVDISKSWFSQVIAPNCVVLVMSTWTDLANVSPVYIYHQQA